MVRCSSFAGSPHPANICPALENPEPLQVLKRHVEDRDTACHRLPQHARRPQPPNHYHPLGSTFGVAILSHSILFLTHLRLVSRHIHVHINNAYYRIPLQAMQACPTGTDPPPITEWRMHQWSSTDFYLIVPLGCHQRDGSG